MEVTTSAAVSGSGAGFMAEDSQARSRRNRTHQQRADRDEREVGSFVAGTGGQDRSEGNGDCKREERKGVDRRCAVEHLGNEVLEKRQHGRTDEPEPGRNQSALPDAFVGVQILQ